MSCASWQELNHGGHDPWDKRELLFALNCLYIWVLYYACMWLVKY